jgi:hypothetical protein
MMGAQSFPSPPWRLRGQALCAVRVVKVSRARRLVPDGLSIVRVAPGRTAALLALVRYGAGSTLQYHEAIIAPALVYAEGRIGMWVSHIYVDHPDSCAAGRQIWGLPKQLAQFTWDDGDVEMTHADISVRLHAPRSSQHGLRAPLAAAVFGAHGRTPTWSRALGSARVEIARGGVQVSESLVSALEFERTQRFLRLQDFDFTLPAPR